MHTFIFVFFETYRENDQVYFFSAELLIMKAQKSPMLADSILQFLQIFRTMYPKLPEIVKSC